MPNYHKMDYTYKGNLVSIYEHDETGLYQVMIREGNGLELTKYGEDWKQPIYRLDEIESLKLAICKANEYLDKEQLTYNGANKMNVFDKLVKLIPEMESEGWVVELWHIDDVFSVREDLTKDQALKVLHQFHDRDHSEDFVAMDYIASDLFGDTPESEDNE